MADQSPFLKTLIGASKQAKKQGWPGTFDPLKTVNDTFSSVMGSAADAQRSFGSGVQGLGRGIGDFSSMAQGNLGAVQGGLQNLGHQLFGAKLRNLPPTPRTGSNVGRGYGPRVVRKSKKAKK